MPRWLGWLFLLIGFVLAVWTVWITISLPSRHLTANWDVAWGGFDAMLTVALLATGVAVIRGSPWLFGAAVCAATLLTVDAWFDVVTSRGRHQFVIAIVQAVLLELPLAASCLYVATREERLLSSKSPSARGKG